MAKQCPLPDMQPEDVKGAAYREYIQTFFDGTSRKILCTEIETPFPEGKLIVSRTDPECIITHANQSFVYMSGWTEQELIGAPHYILRHPDMPILGFKGLWDTLAEGKKWHGYVKNLRKDGGYYWVYATVVANIRDGKLVGYTSVRRKPSRKQVLAHADVYAKLRAEE